MKLFDKTPIGTAFFTLATQASLVFSQSVDADNVKSDEEDGTIYILLGVIIGVIILGCISYCIDRRGLCPCTSRNRRPGYDPVADAPVLNRSASYYT